MVTEPGSSLNNIPRIKRPTAEEFDREYVRKRQPVIITDLFSGQPIREIDTIEKVRQRFGSIAVDVKQEYVDNIVRLLSVAHKPGAKPSTIATYASTVDGYFAKFSGLPNPESLATENPLPAELRSAFEQPTIVGGQGSFASHVVSHWFLGAAGTLSAMHHDGDIASVLHYQVAGRKRHMLAHPREAVKMSPLDTQCSLRVGNFTEQEKLDFARFINAYDAVLEPGEAIFMPAQFWHHIEYVDDAVSFNFRWGRNRYTKFIHENLHRHWRRQHLAMLFFDERFVDEHGAAAFGELVTVVEASYSSTVERYRAVDAKLRELYERLCLDRYHKPYSFLPLEQIEEFIYTQVQPTYKRPPIPFERIGQDPSYINAAFNHRT